MSSEVSGVKESGANLRRRSPRDRAVPMEKTRYAAQPSHRARLTFRGIKAMPANGAAVG